VIRKTFPFIIALLVLCSAQGKIARAQEREASSSAAPAPATAAAPNNAAQEAAPVVDDLSITGSVTAREMRFDVVPNPKVEFTGKPERKTAWEAERQNFPRPVEPGVTYRNIGIQLKITSVFADIDRIVAEALGEVPIRDDQSPAQPATPQQQQEEAAPPTSPPTQPPGEGIHHR
jgi:hypothetical protein